VIAPADPTNARLETTTAANNPNLKRITPLPSSQKNCSERG
jgi:hypothetical protein